MGGGMRQAGYLAAAGIYALDHHVDRLKVDNQRARAIGEVLSTLSYVTDVRPVESNILIFDIEDSRDVPAFLQQLDAHGIKAVQFGPQSIRFVLHLDVKESMVDKVIKVLRQL